MYRMNKDGEFDFINTKVNNNKYVTPLLTDSHLHVIAYGEKLSNPDLEFKSILEIKNIIEAKLKDNPEKLILRGWSEPGVPKKDFLDSINKNIPMMMVRRCGHVATINSKMLEKIDFSGYEQYVDEKDGFIYEQALEVVYAEIGYYQNIEKSFEKAQESLLNEGFGFIHSEDIHGITKDELPFENSKIKVYEKIAVNNLKELYLFDEKKYFEEFNSVKVYTDGSFGGWTALMKENYSDKNTKGKKVWKDEELKKVMEFCEKKHLHLAMHAIGDGAVDQILQIAEKINPKSQHRIIHSAVLHDYQLDLIKKHRFILDMQPSFIPSDEPILKSRLGDRVNITYRFKDILDKNIDLFLSSDAPVEEPIWIRYLDILSKQNISYKQTLKMLVLSPQIIDGFDRIDDMDDRRLTFEENPFENITIPTVEI